MKRTERDAAPGASQRRVLRRAVVGTASTLAAAALLAACTAESLREGPGGMPAHQAARVSLTVAQTRSQFPDLSATAVPYEVRKPPQEDAEAQPEPALRGSGVSVEPGLQRGERQRMEAVLHLDKRDYARGFLEVTRPGQPPQRWPVVAYDQRGSPRERFDFVYVLVTPEDAVRYLVVIGGRYEADGEDWLGFEGTLIVPGPGGDAEAWRRAWKLDFGARFPVVPAHQRKVEQAVAAYREIGRDVDGLQNLRARIAAAEGDLATLRNTEPSPEQAQRHEAALRETEGRLESLTAERDALVEATSGRIVQYYELRKAIAEEYASFTEGNRYRWLDRAGRQQFYDDWKVVEFHHPRIDELVSTFLTFTEADSRVLDTRAAAMETIARHDNWAKDPARSAGKP